MTQPDPRKGSEYGGHPGLIQPPPHDPADSASETRFLAMRTNHDGVVAGQTYVADDSDPQVPPTSRLR